MNVKSILDAFGITFAHWQGATIIYSISQMKDGTSPLNKCRVLKIGDGDKYDDGVFLVSTPSYTEGTNPEPINAFEFLTFTELSERYGKLTSQIASKPREFREIDVDEIAGISIDKSHIKLVAPEKGSLGR